MKKFHFVAVLLVLLTGCQAVAKKMYGIKNPGIENEASIKKALVKYKMDTANVVTLSPDQFRQVMKKVSIPECAFYDSKGKYIEYRRADTSCNAAAFDFVDVLEKGGNYPMPDSLPLAAQLARFRDIKGNVLSSPEPADFYLLIYWAVWTGKLNENHVKVWEDKARQNSKCNIKVIKVNLDMQENWPDSQRISFKVR